MINVRIDDGLGNGRQAAVTEGNALLVASVPADPPAPGTPSRRRFFSTYLTDSGGAQDMAINGSVTPVEYTLEAEADHDLHIMGISILIADSAVTHNNFGAINGGLTTGFDLHLEEQGLTTFLIEKAQTGGQMLGQAGFARMYGTGSESGELVNWTGNSDAQTIYIPIGEWLPDGLRIGQATQDRLVATVNDNQTGLNEMWVQVFGYRLYAGTE